MAGLTDDERRKLVDHILERTKNSHLEGYIGLFEAMAVFLAGQGLLNLPAFVGYLKNCAASFPDDADGQLVGSVFRLAATDLEYGLARAQSQETTTGPAWLRGVVEGGKQ